MGIQFEKLKKNPTHSGKTGSGKGKQDIFKVGPVTRGHQSRLMVPYSKTDIHRTTFFPSAIRLWNQLPESLVNASSLDVFKSGIVTALST